MQTGLLKKKMLLFLKVKCKHLDKLKKFSFLLHFYSLHLLEMNPDKC